jgi:glycosyltransferase involved in cell wall biosynthesis
MKKITHLLYSGLGGHGNVFFSLIEADTDKAFSYSAIFFGVEEIREEYKAKCELNSLQYSYVAKRKGFSIKFFADVYNAIKQHKPDILFLHGGLLILPAYLYSIFTNTKIIVRETQANKLKTMQDWFWLFFANVLSSRIVYLSENFKSEVQKAFGFFFNKKNSVVIPNGINLEKFKPIAKVKSANISIGMVGRLVPIKDHKTLIKSFAKVKADYAEYNLKLYIAGDGITRSELEQLTDKLHIKSSVIFTGVINEEELISLLQKLDIYVHATFGETMSTAIMQAQACALPIIASDVDGVKNVIEHAKTGLLVEVLNVEALTNAMASLLQNREMLEKLSNESLQYAKLHLSSKAMFAKYNQIFNQLN